MAVASFPDVHVTGAVHHFVRVPSAEPPFNGIYYLGTAEVTPQVQRRNYRQDVFNDIAGKTLPFQQTRDGKDAMIAVLFTRFSREAWEAVLRAGQEAGYMPTLAESGTESRWSRGGTVFGNSTFELWQVFENWFNPAGASYGLEIGWYWPQVDLLNDDTPREGTQGEQLLFVMRAQPKWIPQASPTQVVGNERGWVLYTNRESDFPADVRVPQ